MRERPILFKGAMVRAILSGAKTQTRRVVAGVRGDNCLPLRKPTKTRSGVVTHVLDAPTRRLCPFGQPGDRLWVRETWKTHSTFDHLSPREVPPRSNIFYAADDRYSPSAARWRPSIHMPRDACRLVLEITDVRVERLQAISEADAVAEGADENVLPDIRLPRIHPRAGLPMAYADCREVFADLWDTTGGHWDSNPWVWVIDFKRLEVAGG